MSEIPGLKAAPAEVQAYLARLIRACGCGDQVGEIPIYTADDEAFEGRIKVTDNPNGFVRFSPGEAPMIILRHGALGDYRWQNLVAHELIHILHWHVDQFVFERLNEDDRAAYMREVEAAVAPLSIMLMIGGLMNAEWVEDAGPAESPVKVEVQNERA